MFMDAGVDTETLDDNGDTWLLSIAKKCKLEDMQQAIATGLRFDARGSKGYARNCRKGYE